MLNNPKLKNVKELALIKLKAILGLGNPGLRYRFSRHNVGFTVVERLAKQNAIKIKQRAYNCLFEKASLETKDVLLILPLTFMNLSGEAAAAIVRAKRIRPADLLVVLDDVNLPLGRLRIRAKGSDGGHKGLRSIIQALGTSGFPRLRIGVGRPEQDPKEEGLTRYVLEKFNKKETKIVSETVEKAAGCCLVWAKDGIAAAMNRFN